MILTTFRSVYLRCREVQARLEEPHSNLLYLHGWLFPEPGVINVIMERADSDVTTALKQGLSLKTRLKIAEDVANGLVTLHEARYIYQDIKIDSILVSIKGIGDLARATNER